MKKKMASHLSKDSGIKDSFSSEGPYTHLLQRALAFLEKSLKKPIAMSDNLQKDLGVDSLGKIELLMGLQKELNIDISEEQAMSFFMCQTVEELAKVLKETVGSQERLTSVRDLREETSPNATSWQEILAELPSQKTRHRIIFQLNFFQKMISLILIALLKIIFKLGFRLKTEGREYLKQDGPYLICPNHTSYLDGLFIFTALPLKVALHTYFVGDSKFFEHILIRPFIKIARLIPIELNYNLTEALKASAFVLRHSKIVCYFPEGQRSADGEIKTFKKGVGILIKELSVPVMPVYIEGASKTWPPGQRFPRFSSVKVKFAPVIYPDKLIVASDNDQENYELIAKNLQQQVRALI